MHQVRNSNVDWKYTSHNYDFNPIFSQTSALIWPVHFKCFDYNRWNWRKLCISNFVILLFSGLFVRTKYKCHDYVSSYIDQWGVVSILSSLASIQFPQTWWDWTTCFFFLGDRYTSGRWQLHTDTILNLHSNVPQMRERGWGFRSPALE